MKIAIATAAVTLSLGCSSEYSDGRQNTRDDVGDRTTRLTENDKEDSDDNGGLSIDEAPVDDKSDGNISTLCATIVAKSLLSVVENGVAFAAIDKSSREVTFALTGGQNSSDVAVEDTSFHFGDVEDTSGTQTELNGLLAGDMIRHTYPVESFRSTILAVFSVLRDGIVKCSQVVAVKDLSYMEEEKACQDSATNPSNFLVNNDIVLKQCASDRRLRAYTIDSLTPTALGIEYVGTNPSVDWRIFGLTDVNGDGMSDLIAINDSPGADLQGEIGVWLGDVLGDRLRFTSTVKTDIAAQLKESNASLLHLADFDGNGVADLLTRDAFGVTWIMLLEFSQQRLGLVTKGAPQQVLQNEAPLPKLALQFWEPVHSVDFNNDRKADVLWRHTLNGDFSIWYMDGIRIVNAIASAGSGPNSLGYRAGTFADWTTVAAGDFDGDGNSELIWRNVRNGATSYWQMDKYGHPPSSGSYLTKNGAQMTSFGYMGDAFKVNTSQGGSALLWVSEAGGVTLWKMEGFNIENVYEFGL